VYRLLAGGIVLWAGSTMLIAFVGGFVSLLVLRIMLGVGESIAFPGTSKIIARHVPAEHRGKANAAVAAGLALGPAVGTLAGGRRPHLRSIFRLVDEVGPVRGRVPPVDDGGEPVGRCRHHSWPCVRAYGPTNRTAAVPGRGSDGVAFVEPLRDRPDVCRTARV